MKTILPVLSLTSMICIAMSGCSMVDDSDIANTETTKVMSNEYALNTTDDGLFRFPQSTMNNKTDDEIFQGPALTKNINFYVRGLMQNLVNNLELDNPQTPVAVTSFVHLDGDFEHSSLLGNQLAESLMHEIHKVGIPVLDYKVTDYLRVTENGDFIMSRNFNELTTNIPIRYVFTGNLVKHQGGYLVNARVVGIKSKAVVASAQSFLPASVTKALLKTTPDSNEQPIPLTQG